MSLQRLERDTKINEILKVLMQDGAVIIENLIDAETMQLMLEEVEPKLAEQQLGGGEFYGNKKRSIGALFNCGPTVRELALNPKVRAIADGALEAGCNDYRIHLAGSMQVWGGGSNQVLHRELDNYLPFLKPNPDDPEYIVFFMFAGSDFTAENGATRIVPGSHLWDADRVASDDEVVQAVMPQGSLVVWLGKTLHGLAASTADNPRTGISIAFSAGWLRQEENQYLTYPLEKVKQFPEELQQLLGYKTHSAMLGWVTHLDSELQTREASEELLNFDVETVESRK